MSRRPKVDKRMFERALVLHDSPTDIAKWLAIDRRTVYKLFDRFGIDKATLLRGKRTLSMPGPSGEYPKQAIVAPESQSDGSEQVTTKEPERNIQHLPISDFAGVNLSERPRRPRRYY
jgi:hypothetical protein